MSTAPQLCSVLLILMVLVSGRGFAADSQLLDPAGKQPRVAVAADRGIHILYGAGEQIRMRSSADGGASFAPAVTVADLPCLMLGRRRGPQVAANGDVLIAAAIAAIQPIDPPGTIPPNPTGKAFGDILAWRSLDRGATWTGPVVVNDVAHSAREGLFSLAGGTKDTVWAVWLDGRTDKGAQVRAAIAYDQGAQWSTSRAIYQAPDGSVCPCCQPQVAADATGDIAIIWRNVVAGDRAMYAVTSTDHGATFTPAEKLGSGTWPINACPMDGGGVAIAPDHLAAVWRRDKNLFATEVTRDHADAGVEIPLGEGSNGAVAISGTTVIRVWQSGQDIKLQRGDQAPVAIGAGSFPTIAVEADGSAVVAWEASDGVRVAISK